MNNFSPSSYTNLVYFGPFHVKDGDTKEEIYSCLLKCITISSVILAIEPNVSQKQYLFTIQ